jgi:hypothetical protein
MNRLPLNQRIFRSLLRFGLSDVKVIECGGGKVELIYSRWTGERKALAAAIVRSVLGVI